MQSSKCLTSLQRKSADHSPFMSNISQLGIIFNGQKKVGMSKLLAICKMYTIFAFSSDFALQSHYTDDFSQFFKAWNMGHKKDLSNIIEVELPRTKVHKKDSLHKSFGTRLNLSIQSFIYENFE